MKSIPKIVIVISISIFRFVELSVIESGNEIEDYIKTVSSYYEQRHVQILTHFSCFSKSNQIYIEFFDILIIYETF